MDLGDTETPNEGIDAQESEPLLGSKDNLVQQRDFNAPPKAWCNELESGQFVWTMAMEPVEAPKKQPLSEEAKTKRLAVKRAGGACPKHKSMKKAVRLPAPVCPLHTDLLVVSP